MQNMENVLKSTKFVNFLKKVDLPAGECKMPAKPTDSPEKWRVEMKS